MLPTPDAVVARRACEKYEGSNDNPGSGPTAPRQAAEVGGDSTQAVRSRRARTRRWSGRGCGGGAVGVLLVVGTEADMPVYVAGSLAEVSAPIDRPLPSNGSAVSVPMLVCAPGWAVAVAVHVWD